MRTLRILAISLVAVIAFVRPVEAADRDGNHRLYPIGTCALYLDAYAGTNFDADGSFVLSDGRMGAFSGFIKGYLSAVNAERPGAADHFSAIPHRNLYRWIASWCRDNQSKDFGVAVKAFADSR